MNSIKYVATLEYYPSLRSDKILAIEITEEGGESYRYEKMIPELADVSQIQFAEHALRELVARFLDGMKISLKSTVSGDVPGQDDGSER